MSADSDMSTDNPLPRWAYLAGRGRVRVLAYVGNDRFDVLTSRDVTVRVHRDRLKFQKG